MIITAAARPGCIFLYIIDIATLEKTNSDLVDTIAGVLNVQQEGRKKRAEIEQRMAQLTDQLKTALSKSPA